MLPGCRDWCKIQDRSCKCLSPDFWSTLDNYQWTQNWGKSSAAGAWRATDPPLIFPQYSLTLSSQRFGLRVPAHTWPNVKRRLWALPRLWLVNEPPLRRLIGPLKPRVTVSAPHIHWHGTIRISGYIIVTLFQESPVLRQLQLKHEGKERQGKVIFVIQHLSFNLISLILEPHGFGLCFWTGIISSRHHRGSQSRQGSSAPQCSSPALPHLPPPELSGRAQSLPPSQHSLL